MSIDDGKLDCWVALSLNPTYEELGIADWALGIENLSQSNNPII